MDAAIEIFIDRQKALYEGVAKLAAQVGPKLTTRPDPTLNSIAWVIWHMFRSEDYGTNRVLADRKQILDNRWAERLGIPIRHQGTGMEDREVSDFGTSVKPIVLLEYADVVGKRTLEVVSAFSADDLTKRPDETRLFSAMTKEGNFRSEASAKAMFEQRKDKQVWWWLGQRISHNNQHLGEMTTLASLLGVKGA